MSGYDANTDIATIEAAVAQLTDKGRETMRAVGAHETSFFDNGIVAHSGIWGDNLTGELGHASSGVINRLAKLGLFDASPADVDDPAMWWSLTELGADVANYLSGNLNDVPAQADAETAPVVTTKVGAKWTYIYVDGSLVAEVRNDSAAVVIATLSA
jgi:hypothetical protein